jgi:nucleoside-diphosphate-sugar epimerase
MEALRHLIITGSSGFLGGEIAARARTFCPALRVTALLSPRVGGIDLTDTRATDRLAADVPLDDPGGTALIHAAAVIQVGPETPALDPSTNKTSANETMAARLAEWAEFAGIGFSVMVSSVSVYTPLPGRTAVGGATQPVTAYGRDKLNAERVWQQSLPAENSAVVRLAGVWGWQRRPTLFWNRLLLTAARGSPPEPTPVVLRKRSVRNYISAAEASDALIHLSRNRMAGTFLMAGQNSIDTASFVDALQKLPGSRLFVDWRDDGDRDECLYSCSSEIASWARPFEEVLSATWTAKPEWVLE